MPGDLIPRGFDSVGVQKGQKMCISNKFPDDAYAASLGTTFWGLLCSFLIPQFPLEIGVFSFEHAYSFL